MNGSLSISWEATSQDSPIPVTLLQVLQLRLQVLHSCSLFLLSLFTGILSERSKTRAALPATQWKYSLTARLTVLPARQVTLPGECALTSTAILNLRQQTLMAGHLARLLRLPVLSSTGPQRRLY